MHPEEDLVRLLCERFDDEGLRHFIRTGPEGPSLIDDLPGRIASKAHLAEQVVEKLGKRGPSLVLHTLERLLRDSEAHSRRIREITTALTNRPVGPQPIPLSPESPPPPTPRIHTPRDTTTPWSTAALATRLWHAVPPGDDAELWRTAVAAIVDASHAAVTRTADFPDPWRDDTLPLRVLRTLEALVRDSTPSVALDPPEVALLIIGPFLREAAIAGGVQWMQPARPLELTLEGTATGPRIPLEREHQARAPLIRKAARLAEQQRTVDHRALATWMMHTCLRHEPALWEIKQGWFPGDVHATLERTHILGPALRETFLWDRVREVARCIFSDPERIDRDDRDDRLRPDEGIAGISRVRPKLLGYLLCLASWMAMDVRSLPDLIVEHLGLADDLSPDEIHATLLALRWDIAPSSWSLRATCKHPAVDHALRVATTRAEEVLDRIHRAAANNHARLEALSGLPRRLNTDALQPALTADGHPAYTTPHLRFELANEEIKELLMGERLYGDPNLAIRELYQNALDACRYREAREAFIRQTGRGIASPSPWGGEIQFRQDTEAGRPYIECEDNGVGMGLAELTGCFARAGKRFHDMPEFLEEKTEWLRVKPPIELYPNSQFGVGVFSYFMLADELEIETCRFNRDGTLGPRVRVRIAGSGSLFRIQTVGPGQTAGTRVRLYLNEASDSCIGSLNHLLWFAEFRTSCFESGILRHSWGADSLSSHDNEKTIRIHRDIWCSLERDIVILADGISTELDRRRKKRSALKDCSFLIINFRRTLRPTLTIDRRTALRIDDTWIGPAIKRNWEKLVDWPLLSMEFLWDFARSFCSESDALIARLIENTALLPIYARPRLGRSAAPDQIYTLRIPLAVVGCFSFDESLLDCAWESEHTIRQTKQAWLKQHVPLGLLRQRIETWRSVGVPIPSWLGSASPGSQSLTAFVPRLSDSSLVSTYHRNASLIQLVFDAHKHRTTVTALYRRLQTLGVEIPNLTPSAISKLEIEPNDDDLAFLSKGGTGKHPLESGEILALPLLCTAALRQRDIETSMSRLACYYPLGFKPPPAPIEHLAAAVPLIREHLDIFSQNLNGGAPFVEERMSDFHLLRAAAMRGQTIGAICDALAPLCRFCLKLPALRRARMLEHVPTPAEAAAMTTAFRIFTPDSPIDAICRYRGDVALFQLAHRFARLMGIWESQCEPETIQSVSLDETDIKILSRRLSDWDDRFKDVIPETHIAFAAVTLGISEVEVRARLERLAPYGIRIEPSSET